MTVMGAFHLGVNHPSLYRAIHVREAGVTKASRQREEFQQVVKMTRSELARKNLELLELLTQEILENESFAKRIPKGAAVFVLPENDPDLAAANRKLAQRARREGKKVVLVRLELVPKTAYIPQLTVLKPTR